MLAQSLMETAKTSTREEVEMRGREESGKRSVSFFPVPIRGKSEASEAWEENIVIVTESPSEDEASEDVRFLSYRRQKCTN